MKKVLLITLIAVGVFACAQQEHARLDITQPATVEPENQTKHRPGHEPARLIDQVEISNATSDNDHVEPKTSVPAPIGAQMQPLIREQRNEQAQKSMAIRDYTSAALAAGVRMQGAAEMVFAPPMPGHAYQPNREGYDHIAENGYQSVRLTPLSTFGLDVDTASYSNVRRYLSEGRLPPADAVRVEELINYFDYDYSDSASETGHPLRVSTELAVAPWNPAHRIAMIGVQAKDLQQEQRAANRLVFLIDTSGSMNQDNKLPLLKRSFQILVEQMRAQDSVAIVTYAGSAGLVLPPTSGHNKEAIYAALSRLSAGGSTAGAHGIELAYQTAMQQFLPQGNNRVILATDGDFNVGQSSDGELVRMIEARRDSGIFLSVLGFGTGNYQDAKMQKIADHGNGTHHYIDTDKEAERVFRDKLQGTLYTVAKDVKIQIEWNPAVVAQYRLIGYENRLLNAEDFKDDRKDAGDVGAGHSVTVLYEIIPAQGTTTTSDETLRYQAQARLVAHAQELALVKLRYKQPNATSSQEFQRVIPNQTRSVESASANLRWASAVAELGLLLSNSAHQGTANYDALIARAQSVLDAQPTLAASVRSEFISLSRQAKVASLGMVGVQELGMRD